MDKIKIAQRIKKVMSYYALTSQEFSLKTDIPKSTVDSFEESDFTFTLTIIQKICKSFPQINARWLLLNEGRFLIESTNKENSLNKLTINILIEDFKLPLLIERKDEEFYRSAGKHLKDKIYHYKQECPNLDITKVIKRVGYQLAIELIKNENIKDLSNCESQTNMFMCRQAAINFRKEFDIYYNIFPYFEYKKLYSIIAYQFSLRYQKSIMSK